MDRFDGILERARAISWEHLGREITFFLPGMIVCNHRTGRYPAISITGSRCALNCDHCRAKILEPMIPAESPDRLLEVCLRLAKNGTAGVLLSGGCDENGRLPWQDFIAAIRRIKSCTDLFISIHSGIIDCETAGELKSAGVDQALIDVIGDDRTLRDIYHVGFGVARIDASLAALARAGIAIVPHIVCGLHYGRIRGEKQAIEMISGYPVEQLVVVSLMPIPDTPLRHTRPLNAAAVAEIIAAARFRMPQVKISLGCARRRGDPALEILAIDAGVNRIALPSEEAVARARHYGLQIRYQATCCSVTRRVEEKEGWV